MKLTGKPAGRATARATGLVFVILVLALATTPATHAVGTARWQFDEADDFLKGELEGLRVVSDGALRPGYREVALGEFGKEIWSATAAPDGTIYFGTGTPAAVHALAGNDKVREIHAFEEDDVIAVTDLALDQQGRLYLATLAGGKILRLNPKRPDQVEVFGEFENHYLWAIRFDREGRLYVATGPEGKIYRLSPGGESREWYDTDDANILCLDFDEDGALLAGGSDSGKLYRITDPGEGTVIHQFEEQEIKALVRTGNDLFIGVNRQQDSGRGRGGPTISVSKPPSSPDKQPDSKAMTQTTQPAPPAAPVRLARPPSPVILHGAIYRRTATARYEELLQQPKEAVLALAAAAEGGVYAAFGDSARVYRVIDIDANELLFDFDEQQALTLATCEGQLCFVGTGNTGSGYRIETATATQPTFTSQPLDAAFRTRWGNAAWNPAGGIQLATRSGNTSEPDDSWSDWSDPIRQSPGAITSPAARFLQVRVRLEADDAGRLDELEIFYRVQNQKPHIQEFSVEDAGKKNGKDNQPKSRSSGKSKNTADDDPARSETVTPGAAATERKLSWKASDPDGDDLVYRLAYRLDTSEHWVSMPEEKPLTATSYEWDTESVADGTYRLRLTASDEQANAAGKELVAEKLSEPVTVDNRRPEITDLRFDRRTQSVIGRATDNLSLVVRLEYAVDGGEWVAFASHDGIFDEREELFEQKLDLEPGPHSLAIRVTDERGNTGVFHLEVKGR